MQYKILILLLTSSLLIADEQLAADLNDLQLEASFLLIKKEILEQELRDEQHREVEREMQAFDKMTSYRWNEFVANLKEAQLTHNRENHRQNEIDAINQRLQLLMRETNKMAPSLNQNKSEK